MLRSFRQPAHKHLTLPDQPPDPELLYPPDKHLDKTDPAWGPLFGSNEVEDPVLAADWGRLESNTGLGFGISSE